MMRVFNNPLQGTSGANNADSALVHCALFLAGVHIHVMSLMFFALLVRALCILYRNSLAT